MTALIIPPSLSSRECRHHSPHSTCGTAPPEIHSAIQYVMFSVTARSAASTQHSVGPWCVHIPNTNTHTHKKNTFHSDDAAATTGATVVAVLSCASLLFVVVCLMCVCVCLNVCVCVCECVCGCRRVASAHSSGNNN